MTIHSVVLQMGWIFMDSEPLVLDPSPRLMPNKAMLLSDLGRTDVTFRADLSRNGQVFTQHHLGETFSRLLVTSQSQELI